MVRTFIEVAGLALIVASAFTINVTVGLAVAGVSFVFAANFAGESNDANVAERDPDESIDLSTVDDG